ncbi:phage portal protein [Nocardioides sp. J54]|uniref:phage portal protein n=1 Tax=Nocardioides sp. J54 TaxID=935866 RepID=UPI00048BFFA7|nr:phage portal protein [Nocardioides sp. J54]
MSLLFGKRSEERSAWWSSIPTVGGSVTEDSAPRLAPLFAAHRHIVDYIATLPVDTFRKDGTVRTAVARPQLLQDPDSPGGPGIVSWLGQAAYGLANGNAVGWIVSTDGYGYPTRVQWLHWSKWSYDEHSGQWYVGGQPVGSSNLIHIPWIVPPGKTLGLSPIEHYATTIRAGLSAQEYADLKRGGGLPPAQVKNNQKTLDPKQSEAIKNRVVASFAKGEPFVTGSDWDLTAITIPPNQAQFVETLKMSANQIAAAFGIDPTEVGGQAANSLTYSTEELRQINRAANMRPYIVRLEEGLSRYLPQRQFIKLNVDANMRVDIKTRTEVTGQKIRDGRMSVNEARSLEDQSPVPGGDFYNVPAPKAEPTNRNEGAAP